MLDALLLALRLQVLQVDSLCGLQDGAGLLREVVLQFTGPSIRSLQDIRKWVL